MRIVPTNDRIFGLNPLSTSVIFGPLSEILDEVNGYDDTHDFNDSTAATDCNDDNKFKHGPIQDILKATLKNHHIGMQLSKVQNHIVPLRRHC